VPCDAAHVQRHPSYRADRRACPVQALDRSYGDRFPLQLQGIADSDGARAERAGEHRATTAHGERTVHPEPDPASRIRRRPPDHRDEPTSAPTTNSPAAAGPTPASMFPMNL